jgi:hypothetical protein
MHYYDFWAFAIYVVLPTLLHILGWLVGIILAAILVHRRNKYAKYFLVGSILLCIDFTMGLSFTIVMVELEPWRGSTYLVVDTVITIVRGLMTIVGIASIIIGFWKVFTQKRVISPKAIES